MRAESRRASYGKIDLFMWQKRPIACVQDALQNTPLTSCQIRSTVLGAYPPALPHGTCSKDLARKQSPKLRPHVLLGRLQCTGATGWEERERSSEMPVGRLQCGDDARFESAGVSQEEDDIPQRKVSQATLSQGKDEVAEGGGQAWRRTEVFPLQLLRQLGVDRVDRV